MRFEVDTAVLRLKLEHLARKYQDLSDLMRRLAGVLAEAVEVQFEAEGVPPWPALRPSTIRARRRRGHWPGKILQETGRLAASITARWTRSEAAVGTNVEYGAYHQLGTRRMPARPFLRLRPEDEEELIRVTEEWAREMAEK